MNGSDGVLVFSKRHAGAVRAVSEVLRKKGQRPILVSEFVDDPHRDLCDAHVVVDWNEQDLKQLIEAVGKAGVVPVGVVNVVESLISWQIDVARHYGLPGGEKAREIFLSKSLVRGVMQRIGLSELWFDSGYAGSYDVRSVERYPVIIKPARESGGSRLVRQANTPEELGTALHTLSSNGGHGMEVVIESYIGGVEFSIDGPVVGGVFHDIFVVEKTQHNEQRHHDAGPLISPPVSAHVASAAASLAGKIGVLCRELEFMHGWLHVEGRATKDGTGELIEINIRFGGGLYRAATTYACGIDPVDVVVSVALGEAVRTPQDNPGDSLLVMLGFDADRVGKVVAATSLERIKRISGVLDGYVLNSYQVHSLDYENFIAEFLVVGDTMPELQNACEEVMSLFRFRIE
ncbi:ATP-grasp domain-containing protein [Streptomyces lasalocidi]